ncbi:MAG: hypothetical protein ACLTKE_12220 [Coprococcus sp.]
MAQVKFEIGKASFHLTTIKSDRWIYPGNWSDFSNLREDAQTDCYMLDVLPTVMKQRKTGTSCANAETSGVIYGNMELSIRDKKITGSTKGKYI